VTAVVGNSKGKALRGSIGLRELLIYREPTLGKLAEWGLVVLDILVVIGELIVGDKVVGLIRCNSIINRRLLKDPKAGLLSLEGDRDRAITL
jgi:hypothetical protein